MVLFVTGVCDRGCFYCPLSEERRGRDIILADETIVKDLKDILVEARAIDALGSGITGGEPLMRPDLVIECLRLLKCELGEGHHIHLYTGLLPGPDLLARLRGAGLDEIRMHPPLDRPLDIPHLEAALREAVALGMEAGVEIPAIEPAVSVVMAVRNSGGFLNLNELEFSETNQDLLEFRGFRSRDDSCGAIGSEEIAMSFRRYGIKLHYCSSSFKDAVQLRERLKRRARNVRRPFDDITDDGTIVYGEIVTRDINSAMMFLERINVPGNMYAVTEHGIEIAGWILEEISVEMKDMDCGLAIVERYPIEGGLVVERIPL